MVVAFLTSVRATQTASSKGSVSSLKVMRHSTCCIGSAELAIYLSLFFFLMSLRSFVSMQYTGPTICPSPMQDASVFQPHTFCSLLGSDFVAAAQEKCSHATSTEFEDALCMAIPEDANAKLYYGWSSTFVGIVMNGIETLDDEDIASMTDPVEMRFKIVDTLANGFCRKDTVQSIMDAACASPSTAADKLKCQDAFSAWKLAGDCADGKTNDARKCFKVCPVNGVAMNRWFFDESGEARSSTFGNAPAAISNGLGNLMNFITMFNLVAEIVLVIVMVFRFLVLCRQARSVYLNSDAHSLAAMVGDATGLLPDSTDQPASSDEEHGSEKRGVALLASEH